MIKYILSSLILLPVVFDANAQQIFTQNVIAGADGTHWQGFKSNGPSGKWGFQQNDMMFIGLGGDLYNKGFSSNAMGIFNGAVNKEDIFLYNVNSPNADFMVLKASGNVGIGTVTPSEKLTVNGNMLISGISNPTFQMANTIYLQIPMANENNWTRSSFGQNIRWNDVSKKWAIHDPNADFSMMRFENGGTIGFYNKTGSGTGTEITDQELSSYKRLTIDNTGNLSVSNNLAIGCNPSPVKIVAYGGNMGGNVTDKTGLLQLQNHCGGNLSLLDIFSYRNNAGNDWLTATTRIQQSIDDTKMAFIDFNPKDNSFGIALGTGDAQRLIINGSGQVGIAALPQPGYQLAVNGDALFTKVKVKQYPWADYVFDDDYKLRSLKEVEAHIKQYRHLPGVPSEKDVQQNGLDVGDNQATLLKKIEELTLYLIEQNKQIEWQQIKIEALTQENKQIEQIKSELRDLKRILLQ